jgi:hypothetical protein
MNKVTQQRINYVRHQAMDDLFTSIRSEAATLVLTTKQRDKLWARVLRGVKIDIDNQLAKIPQEIE